MCSQKSYKKNDLGIDFYLFLTGVKIFYFFKV